MLPQGRDGGRNNEGKTLYDSVLGSGQASGALQSQHGGLLDADIDALFDDSDFEVAPSPEKSSTGTGSLNQGLSTRPAMHESMNLEVSKIDVSSMPVRDSLSNLFEGTHEETKRTTDEKNSSRDALSPRAGNTKNENTLHKGSNTNLSSAPNPLLQASLAIVEPLRPTKQREPSLLVAHAAKIASQKAAEKEKGVVLNVNGRSSEDSDDHTNNAHEPRVEEIILLDEHGKPLGKPMKTLQVSIIACVAFVNILASVIIFPFLPFFAAMFYPDVPTSKLGVYIGMLASAYFFGDVIGSLIWGRFADTYGRKPAVLIGLVTSLTGLFLFPFSPRYWVAVVIRFLSGLLCGNNSLTRTMIAEVCDDSNQHRGFSMIGLATGMARLVAPAVGGILALPAQKYPSVFQGTVFETYPYFLPCFIGVVLTLLCIVAVVFYVEETLPPPPPEDLKEMEQEMTVKGAPKRKSEEAPKTESLLDVVTEPAILNILVVYFIHSFVGVISHEIIPMWVVNKREDHGFEFDTTQIGTLATLVSPFQILFQGYMYPVLAERWLYIKLFKNCAIVYGIALFFLPYVSLLAYSPNYILWPTFILVQGVAVCARIGAFTCIFALLSNSCDKGVRASINGIGQSVSSAGRMLGPTVAGAIFSWSLNNNMSYPFNYHCLFLLLTICCASSYVSAMYMMPELDFQKHNATRLLAERRASEAAQDRAQMTESRSYRLGNSLTRVKLVRETSSLDFDADDDEGSDLDVGRSLISKFKARR